MVVLSDLSLRPVAPGGSTIGPASVDLTLGETLLRLPSGVSLDPEQDQSGLWEPAPLGADGRWRLERHALYLGATAERIEVPDDVLVLTHGRSSLGRLGLLIHVTAGVCDPGFRGNITLEIVSLAGPILLRPGMRICQVTYHVLDGVVGQTYAGKYLDDSGPVPSRMYAEASP
jgi:dCTP deaminase